MARRKNSESIGNDSEFGDNYVEEPNFSDPEDFEDDIDEDGKSDRFNLLAGRELPVRLFYRKICKHFAL